MASRFPRKRAICLPLEAWTATKAGRVLRALNRIGWTLKRQSGSHRVLAREGWNDYVFAFHDGEEIGPHMPRAHREAHGPPGRTFDGLSRMAKSRVCGLVGLAARAANARAAS